MAVTINYRRGSGRFQKGKGKGKPVPKPQANQQLIKTIVKQQIKKNLERKLKMYHVFAANATTGGEVAVYGSGLSNSGTRGKFVNILDGALLTLGTGSHQQQRNGNSIQNVRLILNGWISTQPFDPTTNSSTSGYKVHMLIYKRRNDRDGDPDDLMVAPNNINVQNLGDAKSACLDWNKDTYKIIKHRTFSMRSMAVTTTSSNFILNSDQQDAGSKLARTFRMRMPVKKTFIFDDENNTVQNDYLCVAFYVSDDKGVYLPANHNRCNIEVWASLSYTDA